LVFLFLRVFESHLHFLVHISCSRSPDQQSFVAHLFKWIQVFLMEEINQGSTKSNDLNSCNHNICF
jgi:hypothetical protein